MTSLADKNKTETVLGSGTFCQTKSSSKSIPDKNKTDYSSWLTHQSSYTKFRYLENKNRDMSKTIAVFTRCQSLCTHSQVVYLELENAVSFFFLQKTKYRIRINAIHIRHQAAHNTSYTSTFQRKNNKCDELDVVTCLTSIKLMNNIHMYSFARMHEFASF